MWGITGRNMHSGSATTDGRLFSGVSIFNYYFSTLFWEIYKGNREELHFEYRPEYSQGHIPLAQMSTAPLTRHTAVAIHFNLSVCLSIYISLCWHSQDTSGCGSWICGSWPTHHRNTEKNSCISKMYTCQMQASPLSHSTEWEMWVIVNLW